LAQAYFCGPASLREAIEAGKLNWTLEQMKCVPEDREGCNDFERALLGDLDSLQRLQQRVMLKCQNRRLQSRAFFAQPKFRTPDTPLHSFGFLGVGRS